MAEESFTPEKAALSQETNLQKQPTPRGFLDKMKDVVSRSLKRGEGVPSQDELVKEANKEYQEENLTTNELLAKLRLDKDEQKAVMTESTKRMNEQQSRLTNQEIEDLVFNLRDKKGLENPKSSEDIDQIIKNKSVTLMSNDNEGNALKFLEQKADEDDPGFDTLMIGDLLGSQVKEFMETGDFKTESSVDQQTAAYHDRLKTLMGRYKAKGLNIVGVYPNPEVKGDRVLRGLTEMTDVYDPSNPESRKNFTAEQVIKNLKDDDKVIGLITGMALDEGKSVAEFLREKMPLIDQKNGVQVVKLGNIVASSESIAN